MTHFSLDEAKAALPGVRALADELIELRPTLVDDAAIVPDRKAAEARLSEILEQLADDGIEVKGWAPLLLDFPSTRNGRAILLCWLEGERDITWYHDPAHGFAGRKRLS